MKSLEMDRSASVAEIIDCLKGLSDPAKAKFKEKKFAIKAGNTLGIYQSDINTLARSIGYNSKRAIELYHSGIYEARILCAKTFRPKDLSLNLARNWINDFENWEVCDVFCMKLFAASPLAVDIIQSYSEAKGEFERRASFATIAGYCSANKKAVNSEFQGFLGLIQNASDDERLYVKKAVNWALRSIGKRNKDLQNDVIEFAEKLKFSDSKAAQWIAKDALRELTAAKVRISDYPRSIYRPG